MEKTYYRIGEVADILGESVSLVRFWSDSFAKFIKPKRNAKGNRLFSYSDLETFKMIHFLVRECGLTHEGAARRMSEDRRPVESKVKALELLSSIRAQLEDVKKML